MEYLCRCNSRSKLYCLSYLKAHQIFDATLKANEIFNEILEEELKNDLPPDVKTRAEKNFLENYKRLILKHILKIYLLMIVPYPCIIGHQ